MPSPRFTIVIPTRNRPETLAATIRTCLAQAYDDFEIVVSDNFCEPETRDVVEGFSSPRIKYRRTESLLAMSANWEFALGQASGEYVTFVGDDDGLLLHALSEASTLISELDVDVLRMRSAFYTWPTFSSPAFRPSTYLIRPLEAPS